MEEEKDKWAFYVRGLLKAEMARRNLSFEDLANLLAEIGVHEKPHSINNKINRGTFSAIFLVQCLKAMGREVL